MDDEDDDNILMVMIMMIMMIMMTITKQQQQLYNMYITISLKSMTGILTAINVTDIHMI